MGRRIGGLIIIVLGVSFGAGALGFVGLTYYVEALGKKKISTPQIITIEKNTSLANLGDLLQQQNIVEYGWQFILYARWQGQSRQIQAGTYDIAADASLDATLRQFVAGEVVQEKITFVEGITFRQMQRQVRDDDRISHTRLSDDEALLIEKLEHPGDSLEGYLLPNTYHFAHGTSDLVIFQTAYAAMQHFVEEHWDQRDAGIPLQNPDEALILASIVEKETGHPDERKQIASVFYNRMKRRMRLQSDPTVIYGMGEAYDGNITKADLRRDTPYNTYTRAGMPPTPIALPGGDAILAVLHPDETDYLYFVATGKDGRHYFSKNLKEHNRAVRRYQLNRQ